MPAYCHGEYLVNPKIPIIFFKKKQTNNQLTKLKIQVLPVHLL